MEHVKEYVKTTEESSSSKNNCQAPIKKLANIRDLDERIARKNNAVVTVSADQNMSETTAISPNEEKNVIMKKKQFGVPSPFSSTSATSSTESTTTNPEVEMLDERIARKTQYTSRTSSSDQISAYPSTTTSMLPTTFAAAPSIPSAPILSRNYQSERFRDEEQREQSILTQEEPHQGEYSQTDYHQDQQNHHYYNETNNMSVIFPTAAVATLVPEQDNVKQEENEHDNDIEFGKQQCRDNDNNHHQDNPQTQELVLATAQTRQFFKNNVFGNGLQDRRIVCLFCFLFMIIVGLAIGIGIVVGGSKDDGGGNIASNNVDLSGEGTSSPPPSTTMAAAATNPPPPHPSSSQVEDNLGDNGPDLEWVRSVSKLYSTKTNESRFGRSVSTNSDNTMIAISSVDSTTLEGIVQVYKAADDEDLDWIEVGQTLRDGIIPEYEYGQFVALSSSSNTGGVPPRLAVGERLYNDNDGGVLKEEVGRVHVYQLSSSTETEKWIEMGEPIVGKEQGETFGSTLSFANNGGVLAVGAPDPSRKGVVRIYAWRYKEGGEGGWIQWGGDIVGDDVDDRLGKVSLSDNGNIVAVGAREAQGKGRVRVYEMKSTPSQDGQTTIERWKQMGQDLMGEKQNDKFGWSLSLSPDGENLAVGGRRHDGGRDGALKDSGHVKVFQYTSTNVNNGIGGEKVYKWDPLGKDLEGEYAYDKSGASVSLSSNTTEHGLMLAIGANQNDGGNYANKADSGHVRVYRYDDKENMDWVQVGSDVDGERAGDEFGKVVKISHDGKRLVASAPFSRSGAEESGGHSGGSVYVYNLELDED